MTSIEKMAKDLRVFSDPATPFEIDAQSNGQVRIKLIRETEREYLLDPQNGRLTARHAKNRQYKNIAALLASEEFIDIRRFRANQRRILVQRIEENGEGRPVLEPEGSFVTKQGLEDALNRKKFEHVLGDFDQDHLSIVLVDGPAGIGKTSLIESISLERSAPDSSLPPLLHVVSGGSKLTDLSKALAHSLQIIRSVVTFDQVPILVRLGVIQVAIDGFDELVDPDGYKDAWSALREFLGEVAIGGPIVLSGRDTFFDQQNFEKLLANRIGNLSIKQARLSPVSPSAGKEYLRKSGWSEDDLEAAQAAGWFRPGSYQLRPFFLSQIAGEKGWEDLQFAHGSPQAFLVSRMVTREAKLVSRSVDISVDKAEIGLFDFFGALAEDMSIQQSDVVDEDFIYFACETSFESLVEPQDLGKLVHRAGSFALLESSSAHGARRFPHTEFQNQFAARALLKSVAASASSTTFLRQANINSGLAEAFADEFGVLLREVALRIYDNLKSMLSREGFSDKLSSNISSLLIATLGRPDLDSLHLDSVTVSEARVVGLSRECFLKDVSFGHLDLTNADCRAIQFDGCEVGILTVNRSTALPKLVPVVGQVHKEEEGVVDILRAPNDIRVVLNRLSVDSNDEVDGLPLMRYFDRLCRTFIRQYQIRDHDEEGSFHLIRNEFWPVIREILGDRIYEQVKIVGGPRSVFYRMDAPESLLSPGGDAESLRVRNLVRAKAIELA